MTTLLRDGYGFSEHSRDVTFALESDGMEVTMAGRGRSRRGKGGMYAHHLVQDDDQQWSTIQQLRCTPWIKTIYYVDKNCAEYRIEYFVYYNRREE